MNSKSPVLSETIFIFRNLKKKEKKIFGMPPKKFQ